MFTFVLSRLVLRWWRWGTGGQVIPFAVFRCKSFGPQPCLRTSWSAGGAGAGATLVLAPKPPGTCARPAAVSALPSSKQGVWFYSGCDASLLEVILFLELNALKGPGAAKYFATIEHSCRLGAGRQALRILDASMSVTAERLAMTALNELQAPKCDRMARLEETLNRFELLKAACRR